MSITELLHVLDSKSNVKVTDKALHTSIIGSSGNPVDVNAEGQLHVVQRGKADTGNSIENNLDAGEVWTGASIDILDYAAVGIKIHSDVAGSLQIQFSPDEIEWRDGENAQIVAGGGEFFTPTLQNQYMRLIYTNGATSTSDFGIHTILHKNSIKWSSHNIKDPIKGEDDAELVLSVQTGKAPSGVYKNVNVTEDGDMTISDNSSGLSIAQGKVTDTGFVHKFGNAPNFDTGDGEVDIWDGANDGASYESMVYTFSTTNDIDSVCGDSTSDVGVDIAIEGLDIDYREVTQLININGQNRIALTTPLLRAYRMYNANGIDLVGNVYCYVDTPLTSGVPTDTSKIRAIIRKNSAGRGNGQTLMAIYTVPNGIKAYMRGWYAATAGAKKDANYLIKLYSRNFNGVFRVKHVSALSDIGTSSYQHRYDEPQVFDEKTDIIMTAQVLDAAVTDASISAGFDIVDSIPTIATGFILQENGTHLLQETGDKILR